MTSCLRPATKSDIARIHAQLVAALRETFADVPVFVEREAARFSPDYLRALIKADPRYVLVVHKGAEHVGFMLSGPDQGNLIYFWGYIEPAHRKGGLALSSMSQFVQMWDKGRFHKISAYTTAGNRVAQLLMQRNGFKAVAVLEKHIFGQDFQLFEKPLNKALPGYDPPVFMSFKQQLGAKLRRLFS